MKLRFLIGLSAVVVFTGCEQNRQTTPTLASTPFYGNVGMREATLWFQLSKDATNPEISLEYGVTPLLPKFSSPLRLVWQIATMSMSMI